MKVNLQKIIISSVAIIIGIFSLNIISYALENEAEIVYKVGKDVYLDTTNLCNAYSNGEISYDDLMSGLAIIAENASLSYLDHEANKINSLIGTLNKQHSLGGSEHGGGSSGGSRQPVTDIWNDICNKNNVPTDTVQTPTEDMNGYGVKVVIGPTYEGYEIWYGNHITLYNDKGYFYPQVLGDCLKVRYVFDKNTNSWFISDTSYGSPLNLSGEYYNFINSGYYKVTGDVRYQEDSPALPEYAVGTIENTIKKFDDMTDKELEELIDDFQTKLENENPNLDEIEDILRAIYWKLKQQEDDTIKPDDLDSLINSAIDRLISKDCACGDILALLQEMKLCENVQDIRDKLFEIFPEYDFEENFSKIEYLKILLRSKFSFIDSIKNFVTYCFNEYSNTSESPKFDIEYNGKSYSINFNAFNDYLPTIQWILAGYIYITYAYHTYRKIPSYINGGDNE